MLQKMEAEVCFTEPDRVGFAIAELVRLGFAIEILPWTDVEFAPAGTAIESDPAIEIVPRIEAEPGYLPTIWFMARIDSYAPTQSEFLMEMCAIIDPHGGFVVEAGYVDPALRAAEWANISA